MFLRYVLLLGGILTSSSISISFSRCEISLSSSFITFAASRSDLQILDSLKENNFKTEVGPGVYDIHSPRVPSTDEIKSALKKMLEKIDADKLWVNPDCGLKTRGEKETLASLYNLVKAAKELREEYK